MTESTFEIQLSEQKAKSRELEETAERARVLAAVLEDIKTDLARHEAQQQQFAAFGDKPIEIAFKQYVQALHAELDFQPFKSLKTGKELAAGVGEEIDYLRGQIAEHEAEIARLLAPTEVPGTSRRKR